MNLAPLLVIALGQASPEPAGPTAASVGHGAAPALSITGEPDAVPVSLSGAAAVERLCRALEPADRVRARGDAVTRAVVVDAHDLARDEAEKARYAVVVPAGKLAFAPWDRVERRLSLADAILLVPGGRLYEVMERGLPVEASVEGARRILAAQRKGDLQLSLVFDLPDEAGCSRSRPRMLPIEPVSWAWRDGTGDLARGGAGAERPLVGAASGARPAVSVGEPMDGPEEARSAVEARADGLRACYEETLARAPTTDGVLVAVLGTGDAGIAADSVGDEALSACVVKTLAGAVPSGRKAAVPIRFELVPPDAAEPDVVR